MTGTLAAFIGTFVVTAAILLAVIRADDWWQRRHDPRPHREPPSRLDDYDGLMP